MRRREIADLISGNVVQLPASATVLDAARLMYQHRIGCLPIIEAGKLRGIFTERDALYRVMAVGRDPGITPLSGVMTPHPDTVMPETRAVDALRIMREGGFRHLPVVSEGEVIGMVSLRDFAGVEIEEVDEQLEFAVQVAQA
jgi:CBS domain-containing protein